MKYKLALLSLATIFASSALAKDSMQLDQITVNAQKIEENAQSVPISMSVFNEFLINDKNIKTMEDLTKVTPNLSFVNQGTSGIGSPTMRGLFGEFHNFNTPTVIYVDGVPILNGLGYNTSIENVEQIEVLKGPQGTLYGKNSEAGVINITTKKPTNKAQAALSATLGTDGKKEYSANASGALIKDSLYLGISLKQAQKDGFMNNTFLDKKVGDRENFYGRLNVRATPTENLELSWVSSLMKYNDGDALIGLSFMPKYEVRSDILGYNKALTHLHSLKIDYQFNDMKLESITAYRKYEDNALQDWDFSNPTDPMYFGMTYHAKRPKDNNFHTLSQELRLSGENSALKWLSGIYLDKDEVNFVSKELSSGNTISDLIHSHSIGIFGHLNYKLSDKLSILGGLRLDKEEKEHKGYKLEKNYDAFSPKIALNYQLSTHSMAYANIAQGYRAGGFNTSASVLSSNQKTFDQESLISYEIGFKNHFFNKRLLFNIAMYYMDISDMQVKTSISPFDGYTSNAGKATSFGTEIELNYALNESITLFSSIGFNKTTFDEFIDNVYNNSGVFTGKVNYAGNDNIYSPRYNYNFGISYRDFGGFFARTDISGFSSMYTDKQNNNKVDGYALVDAKVGYESDKYEIYLYAKNLFDKEHFINGYEGGYTIYSEGREIGLQATYRF